MKQSVWRAPSLQSNPVVNAGEIKKWFKRGEFPQIASAASLTCGLSLNLLVQTQIRMDSCPNTSSPPPLSCLLTLLIFRHPPAATHMFRPQTHKSDRAPFQFSFSLYITQRLPALIPGPLKIGALALNLTCSTLRRSGQRLPVARPQRQDVRERL